MSDVSVEDQVVSSHTGVTHVYLQQRHQGIPVANGIVNVNVARDGTVLSAGNRFVADLAAATAGQDPAAALRGPVQATSAAARHVGLTPTERLVVVDREAGPARETTVSDGGISQATIPAELVWLPLDSGVVRLAWTVEIDQTDGLHFWVISVDAATGAILRADDRIVHDDIGALAGVVARHADPVVVAPEQTVDDGSSYRVFPIPSESPSDGERALVTNPASATASPFGWHDTDGAAGPEFTRTRGNNVHAYADRDNNNQPDAGTDPDGGAGLDFDFPLDLSRRPLDSRDAAVTNLFYWNNIIHDVLDAYGFDGPAGNFQVNNYGPGGVGGDDVRAEAQDGSGRNNANFNTPVDGQRPRMQMFEWRSAAPNPIVVHAPSPIAGTYFGPMAGFGESLFTTGPISGEVVHVGRGCDPAYQTSVPPQPLDPYLADPAGKIALIDRGSCTFVAKVKKAQDLGALMVIVANNAPGPAIAMGGADPTIEIPSVMVTFEDGNLFKANDPFNATVSDGTGGAPDRDSDLDAGVIAHEYGHGLSNRLTGGPGNVDCLDNNEQMGEGWSDFLAVTFTTHPDDRPITPRGVGSYVSFQPPDGPGIRPRPYTSDVSVNEFNYGMIPAAVQGGVLTVPARHRVRVEHDVDRHVLEPRGQARLQPQHLRTVDHRREQSRHPARGRRDEVPAVQPGVRRRPRCDPGRRPGADRRREPVRHLAGVRQAGPRRRCQPGELEQRARRDGSVQPADDLRSPVRRVPRAGGRAAGAQLEERRCQHPRQVRPDRESRSGRGRRRPVHAADQLRDEGARRGDRPRAGPAAAPPRAL